MAADVSSLVRIMNGYIKEDQPRQHVVAGGGGGGASNGGGGGGKSTALITRDLLGGCSTCTTLDSSKELDLDLQVPSGWEKRLDLKSGKVYLQKCSSKSRAASASEHKHQINQTSPKLQDLNLPPAARKPLNLFDDTSLDLKLVSSTSLSSPSSSNYQSVCTLDKVKSALERAEKETIKKRSISMSNSSSPPSNSSSSVKETEADCEEKSSLSFAGACPSCLLYVLISKSNPKCPRCNTFVSSHVALKKPRIDLNISI